MLNLKILLKLSVVPAFEIDSHSLLCYIKLRKSFPF